MEERRKGLPQAVSRPFYPPLTPHPPVSSWGFVVVDLSVFEVVEGRLKGDGHLVLELKNLEEFNSGSHYCPLSVSPLLLMPSMLSWVLSK